MATTAYVALGLLASILSIWTVITVWRTTQTTWTAFSIGTATFQFYTLPLGSVYFPLCLLAGLAAFPRAGLSRVLSSAKWVKYFVVLVCIQFVSLAWSVTPSQGFRYIGYELPLLFVFTGTLSFAERRPTDAIKAALWAMELACATAAFVILFRLFPGIEAAYIASPLARVFISSTVLLEDLTAFNINDPIKAGGILFVNANVGAAFYGFCSVATWYLAKASGSRMGRILSVLAWASVLFTGSKAGFVSALAIPTITVILSLRRSWTLRYGSLVFVCVVAALIVSTLPLTAPIISVGNHLLSAESVDTLSVRLVIWEYAIAAFFAHPIVGQGFGGWENGFCSVAYFSGLPSCYPPHNALIMLWSQSGFISMAAGLTFTVSVLLDALRSAFRSDHVASSLGFAVFGSFAWLFVQSMGENFGVVGETHITPLFGMMLGLLAHFSRRKELEIISPVNKTGLS